MRRQLRGWGGISVMVLCLAHFGCATRVPWQAAPVEADFSVLYGAPPQVPLLGGINLDGGDGRLALVSLHGGRIGACTYREGAMACTPATPGMGRMLRDIGAAIPRALAKPEGQDDNGSRTAAWKESHSVNYTSQEATMTIIFSRITSARHTGTPPGPAREVRS